MTGQHESELCSWKDWVEELVHLPPQKQREEMVLMIRELRRQLKTISSEKLELQSLVQEQQLQIQQQSEQLVKLNESDLNIVALNQKQSELARRKEEIDRLELINKRKTDEIKKANAEIKTRVNKGIEKGIRDYKKLAKVLVIFLSIIEGAIFYLITIINI